MVNELKIKYTFLLLSLIFASFSFEMKANIVYASQDTQHREIDLSNITYIKSETERDIELEEAFSKVYNLKRGEHKIKYYYNRIDLNNDNKPETFVYLLGPYVCGTGGCSGLIFQEVDDEYKLVSRFSLVRTPIIIQEKMTNGWKNIMMYVAGGGITPSYKELKFNGETYPLNPSVQPDVKNGKIKGVGIISDDISENTGIKF